MNLRKKATCDIASGCRNDGNSTAKYEVHISQNSRLYDILIYYVRTQGCIKQGELTSHCFVFVVDEGVGVCELYSK